MVLFQPAEQNSQKSVATIREKICFWHLSPLKSINNYNNYKDLWEKWSNKKIIENFNKNSISNKFLNNINN